MTEYRFVILGGGMVAGYAAKQLVESGLKSGELAIVSAEEALPYERPPLSKGFLAGKDTEEAIRISPAEFYREHGIELKLGTTVSSIDTTRKRLKLKSGDEIGFQKLVVATGAKPRTIDIPGVLYLRSLADSKRIRDAGAAKTAAVIGSGFIGMEVAAVLAQKGTQVTMVMRDDRIWKRLFTPEMSRFFQSYYEARGVRFLKSAAGSPDLVVAGIGAEPVTDLLGGSGIDVDNGVAVNEYLETSQPDIYAAGDVANYQDVLFGKRRRVEHWDNAVSQGQHCARTLMGEREPFRHVPYFFSDVFDLSYEYWGDSSGADQVVHRGDVSSNSFSTWWLRDSSVVAVFTMNRPDEERESAPKWIEAKQAVSAEKLRDAGQPIGEATARAS